MPPFQGSWSIFALPAASPWTSQQRLPQCCKTSDRIINVYRRTSSLVARVFLLSWGNTASRLTSCAMLQPAADPLALGRPDRPGRRHAPVRSGKDEQDHATQRVSVRQSESARGSGSPSGQRDA